MTDKADFKILVDADACPVVKIVERVAKKYSVPVTLLYDTNHAITSDYSEIKIIGAGADAVDFALINICKKGDVVITQDYGVAAMALGKGAAVVHQSGRQFSGENIDGLLMDRHISKAARMSSSKNHMKGPKKRTAEDDKKFESSFERIIREKKDIQY
ncbi:MAG: YaiI/YqxD family protein [Oscillospiraceae bacterium]|nr:YaiI/YqxD family protein [Oscillospiraceae bacterium]